MAEENKVESGVVLPPADFTEQLQKDSLEYDGESDSDHGTEGSCDQTFFG